VEYLGVILLEFWCNFEGVNLFPKCAKTNPNPRSASFNHYSAMLLFNVNRGDFLLWLHVWLKTALKLPSLGESFPANVCVCSSHRTAVDVTCCQMSNF